MVGILLLTF